MFDHYNKQKEIRTSIFDQEIMLKVVDVAVAVEVARVHLVSDGSKLNTWTHGRWEVRPRAIIGSCLDVWAFCGHEHTAWLVR